MTPSEILTLCREAQANPDYVADYPDIAMRLITEALPQVCGALEGYKSSDADKERYTIELYNRARAAEQECDNLKQELEQHKLALELACEAILDNPDMCCNCYDVIDCKEKDEANCKHNLIVDFVIKAKEGGK